MNEYQLPEQILFNYEELKQELTEKVSMYETLVYTDEQIQEAKKDKANLNKLKKALNDERIRREKEYMVPFNDFKTKINEIISIIDKPVEVIDKQVKAFEDRKKESKKEEILEYWSAEVDLGLVPSWLRFEQIFNEKWLNASTSMNTVKGDIIAILEQIAKDDETLSNLPEFGFEAAEVYKATLDINKALAEGQRMAEIQKQKAEAARLKAEADAKKEEQVVAAVEGFMNPPEEKVEAPAKQWVAFQALLSTEDALALKDFFNSRNIEFKAV